MDVLELNDFDREFFRSVGICVPEDAVWPLDGDEREERKDLLILSSRRTNLDLLILNPNADPEAAW
jgi:hypothetical protein